MPVLGLIETPRRLPNSITEAVLAKNRRRCRRIRRARLPRRRPKAELTRILRGTFRMKKILSVLAAAGLAAAGAAGIALGPGRRTTRPSRRISRSSSRPRKDWTFAGPFGNYDKAQLQRGLKVYKEVCSACHSMNLVAFRTLEELGYSEAQVKAFAAEYTIAGRPERRRRDVRPRRAFRPTISRRRSPTTRRPLPPTTARRRRTSRCWPRRAASSAASRPSSSTSSRSMPRRRPGLHLLAADRLWRGAAGRHDDPGRHLLQSVFHRRPSRWRCRRRCPTTR